MEILTVRYRIIINIGFFITGNESSGIRRFKGTVSPAERCDFVGVKLEKVHELFQVCRICGKRVVFYNMAQYGLLYHKSLCN